MQIKNTKAAILVESHKPLVLDEIELPADLAPGQVLVKIHFSGICGAQINEIEAAKGPDKFLPHLLGHEGSATVLEVGPGVSAIKPDDYVVMHWRPSKGIQAVPATYKWGSRKVNSGWVTTFSEYSIVSENRLTVIPKGFDPRIAPLFGCAVTTAMGVINNDARVKVGQSVVVIGVGGVGLNIVQSASLVTAHPIIAIDIVENKLAMAKMFGADYTFNSKNQNLLKREIKDICGFLGADVVIETTGISTLIEFAYEITHPDGRTILVGVPKIDDKVKIYTLPLHFNQIMKGSHGGSSIPHIEIPRYINLIKSNKLNLNGIVTHEFSLNNINEAIKLTRSGAAGRVMLKCNENISD